MSLYILDSLDILGSATIPNILLFFFLKKANLFANLKSLRFFIFCLWFSSLLPFAFSSNSLWHYVGIPWIAYQFNKTKHTYIPVAYKKHHTIKCLPRPLRNKYMLFTIVMFSFLYDVNISMKNLRDNLELIMVQN